MGDGEGGRGGRGYSGEAGHCGPATAPRLITCAPQLAITKSSSTSECQSHTRHAMMGESPQSVMHVTVTAMLPHGNCMGDKNSRLFHFLWGWG